MNAYYNFLICVLWTVASAGIGWCLLQGAQRITYVTLADGQRAERRLPILIRLLLPLAPNLASLFDRPTFDKSRKRIERKLVSAGLDEVMRPIDFLALRILVPLVLGTMLSITLWFILPKIPGRIGMVLALRRPAMVVIVFLLSSAYPSRWLAGELASRHRNMQRSLPFVLDLLTLSVEAGLDFMSALQRIIDRRRLDPLGEELIRVLREIQLGKTRRHALRDMAARADQPDLRSVTRALVQADEMGVSIGAILRIQADQLRVRRFHRAEKLAHEAPVKMLFPLIVCIFPAVFIVLLAPFFLEIAHRWM
jgi:tight adherence protein C